MAILHIERFSDALAKMTALRVVLPEKPAGPLPVVYQLHGLSDDHSAWTRRSSIERYAYRFGIMVVMPDGGRGWYSDAVRAPRARHEAHILETVAYIDRTFRTDARAQMRGIGGLSMGGYGALKLGLKHPLLFGSVAAHSSAADVGKMVADRGFPEEFPLIYGDALAPADDIFALAAQPGPKPRVRFDCGTEDFTLPTNRALHAHLVKLDFPHFYQEYPGAHNWEYWDQHVVEALEFHHKAFVP